MNPGMITVVLCNYARLLLGQGDTVRGRGHLGKTRALAGRGLGKAELEVAQCDLAARRHDPPAEPPEQAAEHRLDAERQPVQQPQRRQQEPRPHVFSSGSGRRDRRRVRAAREREYPACASRLAETAAQTRRLPIMGGSPSY